jgi:hypothetical protein
MPGHLKSGSLIQDLSGTLTAHTIAPHFNFLTIPEASQAAAFFRLKSRNLTISSKILPL